MEDSILLSTKKLLGIGPDYDAFDLDIIMYINSAFSVLQSAGATPPSGIVITGPDEKWSDYLTDPAATNMMTNYVFIKTRLVFDPPATSFVIDSQNKIAEEILWRLNCLELVFDPTAYDSILHPDQETEYVWLLNEGEDFPSTALVGDLGYEQTTADIWRKIA